MTNNGAEWTHMYCASPSSWNNMSSPHQQTADVQYHHECERSSFVTMAPALDEQEQAAATAVMTLESRDDDGENNNEEQQQKPHQHTIASRHLVAEIRNALGTNDVDALGWRLLPNLSSMLPLYQQEVVAAGGLQLVVEILQRFQHVVPMVEVAFLFLDKMNWQPQQQQQQQQQDVNGNHRWNDIVQISCGGTPPPTQILQNIGGVETIMSLMHAYRNNIVIQEMGGRLLASLLSNDSPSIRDIVIEEGGLATLVDAMSLVPNNLDFQSIACNAIQYTLQEDDEAGVLTELFANIGGIGALVDLFVSFGNDGDERWSAHHVRSTEREVVLRALTAACGVLAALSEDCERVKVTFDALNGISAVIHAMQYHIGDRSFELSAMCAIRQLSSGCEDMIGEFGNAGVVVTLKSIMEAHSNDDTVVNDAILTLGCLAMNNCVVADTIMIRGVMLTLVDAMTRHPTNADLQCTACAAIGACALQHDSIYLKGAVLSTPTLIHVIVMAMNQHPASERLQVVSSLTLQDLTTNVNVSHNFVYSGGLDALVASMKQFPLNVDLQDAVISTIGTIAESDSDTMRSIIECGFVPVLLVSICRLCGHEALAQNAIRTLCALMKESSELVKDEILSAGGVFLFNFINTTIETRVAVETRLFLQVLQESENEDIRNAAKAALFGNGSRCE